ncbi:thioredoxin-dependent thiol peroxidase [Psychromonas sp. CD1]|uniref:thioredoxin-dependent thiol peroxidase n=1 Tax=Psychromonas sp. CD1 TaxID=1979839 RepID=UPI000B9B6D98|nr:thioredoxin-dependent thiol peroxidase [Psychromonas sp. CD1]
MKQLIKGDTAPLFTLHDEQDNPVSLADLKGKKVLIYFYPRAMTPGCITQACGLRDSKDDLTKHNTLVYGISPDPIKKLANFVLKKNLNFPLLSDEDHHVAEAFGVWGEKKFMGKTYNGIHRISFLIDEKGDIEHVFDKFKTKEHHQVVLAHLNSL